MAIPAVSKNNFHTLEKAFRNGDIALLECRNRADGDSAYAICAINGVLAAMRILLANSPNKELMYFAKLNLKSLRS